MHSLQPPPPAVEASHRAAELLLRHQWKLWFWGDSIGLEGLLAASEITGDRHYIGFVYGLLKGWIGRQEPIGRWDHTAAGVALLKVYESTSDPSLLVAALKFAEYLNGFRLTINNCPLHYEDAHFELPPELPQHHPNFDEQKDRKRVSFISQAGGPCVFVDSIHFHGPFLARLYRVTGQVRFLEQAERTIGPQIELLWDNEQHLFHHFWSERENRCNGILWGRGNGWGMLGMIHTLAALPSNHRLAARLRTLLALQAARIAKLQDSSGDWHTILDDPDSYLEPSIAAFVVEGFATAIRQGWLDTEYRTVLERAWLAMQSHLQANGLFSGVSYETFPSFQAEHYRTMPQGAMTPWGQGPFLTACLAYHQL